MIFKLFDHLLLLLNFVFLLFHYISLPLFLHLYLHYFSNKGFFTFTLSSIHDRVPRISLFYCLLKQSTQLARIVSYALLVDFIYTSQVSVNILQVHLMLMMYSHHESITFLSHLLKDLRDKDVRESILS